MREEHKCDCRRTNWMRCGHEFLPVLGAGTLLSSSFLGVLLEASNRQDLFWSRADTAALFLVIVLGSGLAYAAYQLMNRLTGGRFAGICKPGVFLIIAVGIVQLVPQKFLVHRGWPVDVTYGAILGVGAAGAMISAFKRMGKLRSALWRGVGGLAVLFPILFIHVLRFPPFVARDDLIPCTSGPQKFAAPSVVVFIFDSISMAQCLDENGKWRSDLPETGRLRSDAVCLDQAVSCGPGTTISLPNLLFQRSPAEYYNNSWDDSWFAVDPQGFTNGVFHMAKQHGYRTGMLGYYLPFGQMFGSLLDGAKDVPFSRYVAPDSFWDRCVNGAVCVAAYARGPFDGSILAGIPRLRYVPGWMNEKYFLRITRQTEEIVRRHLACMAPSGQLFVSFMAIPHSPAIFLSDGTVDTVRATYDSQLRYADKVIGRFIKTMKENGTYDACWVILTSDHGHHGYDLPHAQHRHVPFIVKPPGSAYAQSVGANANLWELAPFFKSIFSGAPPADCLSALPGELDLD